TIARLICSLHFPPLPSGTGKPGIRTQQSREVNAIGDVIQSRTPPRPRARRRPGRRSRRRRRRRLGRRRLRRTLSRIVAREMLLAAPASRDPLVAALDATGVEPRLRELAALPRGVVPLAVALAAGGGAIAAV